MRVDAAGYGLYRAVHRESIDDVVRDLKAHPIRAVVVSVSCCDDRAAARMAAQGAPVDLARIARIKQAIASGNYPVDPEKIAEKMLDLDLPI